MMKDLEMDFTITMAKEDLLEILEANLITHNQAYKESVAGYLRECEYKLRVEKMKLEEMSDAKPSSLHISMTPPRSMAEAYETVISMLNAHTGADLTLNASQYRKLAMDDWEWSRSFWTSNSSYSATAADKSKAYV